MTGDVTDVYNLALISVGHTKRVLSPTEKTTERRHCETLYDPYRKALLTMNKWSFATITAPLTLTTDTPPTGWAYEYKYPQGCLKAIEINKGSGTVPDIPYKAGATYNESSGVHQRVIWTNQEQASLVYVRDVTNPSFFTPLFSLTLAHYMGITLSRLLSKSTRTPTEMFQLAGYYMAEAVRSGEVEGDDLDYPEPDWISDR